ncbi:MAG: leader peptidase (prepilin peptidase) / N-methyltransferase [Chloroflexota bacterium]|jgi:leader peptidase (prepilin peptidase)/N-methyltransferase|nr:leader peptidase (prepilin peptidase) / N-methyltransferase [Chloroflexota bacterium]
MEPWSAVLGAGGFALGLAADRLATRWPEHDEEHPPGRAVDWRTATTALVGAVAFGLLPLRFGPDPIAFLVFGAWFGTLVVGLATDLDQRLLPDLLTLPVIPVAFAYALSGADPLVGSEVILAVAAALIIPAILFLPSIPFGAGAFGIGDVKLLIGVGLLAGWSRALGSVVFALVVAGIVLIVLLAARRIGRRTYVPFGPFFILGALWAVLLRG